MKHGHLTEQRKHFVEAYCRLGNGTLAAKEAGYKDSPSLVNQASKLKRELSAEISEELRSSFMNAAPKALSILMDLAENSKSDSVPTPNRTYLDFLFETDEEKAIKEFEKFVDIIVKKKVKKKELEDA